MTSPYSHYAIPATSPEGMAAGLLEIVAAAERDSRGWTEPQTGARKSPDRWSRKEILSHLIDSAANNHQRFIRMQHADGLELLQYAQEEWVGSTAPGDRTWSELLDLWAAYNRHLAHIIARVRPEALSHRATLYGEEPVTLQFLIEDYIAHMRHHLAQLR